MKKQVNLNYRLMLQANVGYLVKALGVCFLLFTLALIVFATFAITYSHTNLGLIVGFVCLTTMIFTANLILYVLSLSFRSGMVFIMDRRGLTDMASPVQWGLLNIEDIEHIKFSYSLLGDFLKIRLKNPLPTQNLGGFLRKFNAQLMSIIDPQAVYIPLDVLDVTRMNLETQLLHFGALMKLSAEDRLDNSQTLLEIMQKKYDVGGNMVSTEIPESPDVDITDVTHANYEVISNTGNFDVSEFTSSTSSHTFVPPKLDPSASEKTRLIHEIAALKNYVKKKGLDSKVCDLYTDYISQFPQWEEDNDPRLPVGVKKARFIDHQADYEEVHFQYKDCSFQFSLRKDIGPSDMALLSVGFQGRVKMSVRVSVEIAALEPKDVEVFHRDQWETYFMDLFKVSMAGRFGSSSMRELDEETRTQELDLERLKQNFSSNDE